MEITLGGVFVIIFFSGSLSSAETVPGLDLKVGRFQILKKHPALKKCADAFLHENEYAGVCVSELTGECQGLPRAWLLNQTTERGYAYAKKMFVQETFRPPVETKEEPITWRIPGMLITGAKLDTFISIENPEENPIKLVVFLADGFGSYETHLDFIDILIDNTRIEFHEHTEEAVVFRKVLAAPLPAPFSSKEVFKISFLAQNGSLSTLVADEELLTFKPSKDITTLKQIHILHFEQHKDEVYPIFIHSLEFTLP